ncbi:MAG: hypothetical protein PHW04_09930 [Candidatus Wallbacteria bacterium]|nr:hypothetical protein [Candidatus Wallbacteria bacterium]
MLDLEFRTKKSVCLETLLDLQDFALDSWLSGIVNKSLSQSGRLCRSLKKLDLSCGKSGNRLLSHLEILIKHLNHDFRSWLSKKFTPLDSRLPNDTVQIYLEFIYKYRKASLNSVNSDDLELFFKTFLKRKAEDPGDHQWPQAITLLHRYLQEIGYLRDDLFFQEIDQARENLSRRAIAKRIVFMIEPGRNPVFAA